MSSLFPVQFSSSLSRFLFFLLRVRDFMVLVLRLLEA